MSNMNMISIIEKKKNGNELTDDEIFFWINSYCDGKIPDYQVSALLMAIRFQGMSKRETFALTKVMMESGVILNLDRINGIKVDKHSTGGVGDKTSLVLCPLLASLGLKVAKMSGRGLGFTGGTLDKLESIPGMNVSLQPKEFMDIVNRVGMSIIGQSDNMVLADKKLYSLRDVTGTIDSMPLIASSIMSKKLVSGCDCILLDVKYGSGAFMHTKEDAETLAKLMVDIGHHFNKNVEAEITSMNQPLGNAIGNILEVKEAIDTLHNKGPKDFTELCLSSGATMLIQSGLYTDRDKAREDLEESLNNGKALKVFRNFVRSQGGDVSYIDDPSKFPMAMYSIPVRSVKSGYIYKIDTMDLGLLSMKLGAGRETMDDIIDPTAGIVLNKKIGDRVAKGDVMLTIYTEKPEMQSVVTSILNDFYYQDEPCMTTPIIEERIALNEDSTYLIEKD